MSNESSEEKRVLRQRLRAELAALRPAERLSASAHICQRLKRHPLWRASRTILFFFPTRQEPDIWPLALDALAERKLVCLPRYCVPAGSYQAVRIDNPDADLAPGRFEILEPVARCVKFPSNQLDLALVPGIGFSLSGGRLGRGKGFYDRLLAEASGIKCGVAFDFQSAVGVPLEPHDMRVDCIVTPTRWHWVASQARF